MGGNPKGAWDDFESFHSIGDVSKLDTSSKFSWKAIDLRDDVAQDAQHGNSAVGDFALLVTLERFFVPTRADPQRIKETCETTED